MKEVERFGFSILCNRIKTELSLPIKVNDIFSIDKANLEEVELIKSEHLEFINASSPERRENPLEMAELKEIHQRKKIGDPDNLGNKADQKDWHYWLIRHKEAHIDRPTDVLFSLIDSELIPIFDFGFKIYETKDGEKICRHSKGKRGFAGTQIYDLGNLMKKVEITERDISLLNKLILSYNEIDFELYPEFGFINKALKNFRTILRTPIAEDLRNIGKFAIIESLLCSDKSRRLNSINHQLQNKIALLNDRFDMPIQFQKYFKLPDGISIQKIVELLYAYRSDLAHGNDSDFKSKLKILEAPLMADYCVDEICRKTLAQAILEPKLLYNLKQC